MASTPAKRKEPSENADDDSQGSSLKKLKSQSTAQPTIDAFFKKASK